MRILYVLHVVCTCICDFPDVCPSDIMECKSAYRDIQTLHIMVLQLLTQQVDVTTIHSAVYLCEFLLCRGLALELRSDVFQNLGIRCVSNRRISCYH